MDSFANNSKLETQKGNGIKLGNILKDLQNSEISYNGTVKEEMKMDDWLTKDDEINKNKMWLYSY